MRIYCPRCGNDIVKSYPDGKIKLRTNILIFEDGRALCKCQKCKADVKVPVSISTTEKVKYFILEEKHEKSEKSETEFEKSKKRASQGK